MYGQIAISNTSAIGTAVRTKTVFRKLLKGQNQGGSSTCNRSIAKEKGWRFLND
jgi:hypothetical protein